MFEWCSIVVDEHFVVAADVRAAVAGGDEVDGLGRAADEDDLLPVGRVQEAAATVSRACSYASVARSLSEWTPRCTLAFSCV